MLPILYFSDIHVCFWIHRKIFILWDSVQLLLLLPPCFINPPNLQSYPDHYSSSPSVSLYIQVRSLSTDTHTSACVYVLCAGGLPNKMVLVESGAVLCHLHRLRSSLSPFVNHLRHWIGIWDRERESWLEFACAFKMYCIFLTQWASKSDLF